MNTSKNKKDDEKRDKTTQLSSLYDLKTFSIVLEMMDGHQIADKLSVNNRNQYSTTKRKDKNRSNEQKLAEGTSDVKIDYQPATKIFKKDPDNEQHIAGLENIKQTSVFNKIPQHVNEDSLKNREEIKLMVTVDGERVKLNLNYPQNIKTEYFENEELNNTDDIIEVISDDETSEMANVKKKILPDDPVKLNLKKKVMQNSRKKSNNSCNKGTDENLVSKRVTRSSTGSLGLRMIYIESEDEESYSEEDSSDSNDEDEISPDIVVAVSASYEEKVRVVELALDNPSWTIADIKKHSNCKYIENRQQIECWINQVKNGGSYQDKLKKINEWVLEKCYEYKNEGKNITNKIICDWGLEAKNVLFKNLTFNASNRWLKSFKERYNINEGTDGLIINELLTKKNAVLDSYRTRVFIPYEKKVKAVDLARKNPTWSLKEIRKQSGCMLISSRGQLKTWAKQQLKDETSRSKHRRMNTWIRSKCIEYMKNEKKKITNKMLVDWRLEAKKTLKISDLIIEGNSNWVQRFKYKYRINDEFSEQ